MKEKKKKRINDEWDCPNSHVFIFKIVIPFQDDFKHNREKDGMIEKEEEKEKLVHLRDKVFSCF